jgi:pyruvate,water dikinase
MTRARPSTVPAETGGTAEAASPTNAQVVRLARLGRRIEAHFEHPQDIEWCLCR